ncbi:MAG: DegT/DnrJ/EryC1/StrS family aminotransferase [Candidatus Zixiibacteriota bacterium]
MSIKKKKKLIPFHRPFFPADTIDQIKATLTSGWVTTGPRVKQFELELSGILNAEHVIALNSGTAALHLGLCGINLNRGDGFIAPTYTFVATVEVGEYFGAQPLLVDVDPDTYNIDLNQVEDLLKRGGHRIKVIMPVHFAGQAVAMQSLISMAKKYNVFVLEDAAHALETVSDIGKIGNTPFGAAFSFYANKNITTGGEGGAFATNNEKLASVVRVLSLHGMSRDGWDRYQGKGKWAYDISQLGYKYNMTDLAAAIGLSQLVKLDQWHRRRLAIVSQYSQGLSGIPGLVLPEHKTGKVHAWHLYVVRLGTNRWKIDRDRIIKLLNESGIGTSVHFIPIHMHSYYQQKYQFKPQDFPIAKRLSESVITLPLYPSLSKADVDYIIEIFHSLWSKYAC